MEFIFVEGINWEKKQIYIIFVFFFGPITRLVVVLTYT